MEACVMMLLETGMKEEVREPKELLVRIIIIKKQSLIDCHMAV